MEIYCNEDNHNVENKVQIQFKDPINKKSRSFTIKNADLDELFNRFLFICKRLAEDNDQVTIVCYKDKREGERW